MRESANPHIVIEQACAACHFKKIQNLFPVAKTIKEGGKCTDVDSVRADRDEVAGDSLQLRHNDADVFNSFGHLNFQQPFCCNNVGKFVVHRTNIIHPVNVGNHLLVIRHMLAMLLEASMQIANMRNYVDNNFAVNNELEPQHTMCGRMLGPHVDDHLFSPKRFST